MGKQKLDAKEISRRYDQRKEIHKEALEEMEKYLAFTVKQYADGDIVKADMLEEYLVRNMMFKFVNRQ